MQRCDLTESQTATEVHYQQFSEFDRCHLLLSLYLCATFSTDTDLMLTSLLALHCTIRIWICWHVERCTLNSNEIHESKWTLWKLIHFHWKKFKIFHWMKFKWLKNVLNTIGIRNENNISNGLNACCQWCVCVKKHQVSLQVSDLSLSNHINNTFFGQNFQRRTVGSHDAHTIYTHTASERAFVAASVWFFFLFVLS